MKRRDFLKIIGAGGVGTGLGVLFGKLTKAPGAKLIPRLIPPEDVIPGIGTWYSSSCTQCGAGCGTMVKVMEGHARKIEGNPLNPVNKGKLCVRGQAALQALYNPDRIKAPLKRRGERGKGDFEEISWDEAISIVAKNLAGTPADKAYLVSSRLRGHYNTLVANFMAGYGSQNHINYELFQPRNLAYANQVSMGLGAIPHYDIENTKYLLSFGADFSTTWLSPVGYSRAYGEMRQGKGKRGKLVQVEPRLSLSGANADEWVSVRPGAEGILALSIAFAIIEKGQYRGGDAGSWKAALGAFKPSEAVKLTGVSEEKIYEIAKEFAATRPSLALGGGNVARYEDGHAGLVAVNILNHVAGNIGIKGGVVPNPETNLRGEKRNDFKNSIAKFAHDASAGKVKAVLFCNTNPVFTAPAQMKLTDALKNTAFIASVSSFIDETTAMADIVLPVHHTLEDWGDDFTDPAPGAGQAAIIQPVVSPVYNTKGLGDIFISLGKAMGGKTASKLPGGSYADYLKDSWKELYSRNRAMSVGTSGFDEFWNKVLANGGWWPAEQDRPRTAHVSASAVGQVPKTPAKFEGDEAAYPLHLVLYPHNSHLDGRGANSPWLQEIADTMTSVVWGSWVEVNPKTADKLGIKEGDMLSVESPYGKVSAPAYLYAGIRPDTVAMPIGQGHTHYGRYAKGRGANPIEVLPFKENAKTGQIALNSTRVKLSKIGAGDLVKLEGTVRELGRDIVKTITPEEFEKTSGRSD